MSVHYAVAVMQATFCSSSHWIMYRFLGAFECLLCCNASSDLMIFFGGIIYLFHPSELSALFRVKCTDLFIQSYVLYLYVTVGNWAWTGLFIGLLILSTKILHVEPQSN